MTTRKTRLVALGVAATVALLAPAMTAVADPGAPVTGGSYSGIVTSTTGKALKGVELSIAVNPSGYNLGKTATNSKGKFSTRTFVDFTVKGKLAVNRFSGESTYVGGYWAGNGKKVVSAYSKGKTIAVKPTSKVTGIKPLLSTCATVSGKVTNGDAATSVVVFNDASKSVVTRADLKIAKNGTYKVRGLAKGRYYVAAVKDNSAGGAGQSVESFYGTKSGAKPGKANLVVSACKAYKRINLTTQKVVRATSAPAITMTMSDGAVKLTATKGSFRPNTGLTLSYQWYFEGQKVQGATARDFWPPATGRTARSAWVEIRAAKAGYVTAVTRQYIDMDY